MSILKHPYSTDFPIWSKICPLKWKKINRFFGSLISPNKIIDPFSKGGRCQMARIIEYTLKQQSKLYWITLKVIQPKNNSYYHNALRFHCISWDCNRICLSVFNNICFSGGMDIVVLICKKQFLCAHCTNPIYIFMNNLP